MSLFTEQDENTSTMMDSIRLARIAGLFYLLIIIFGLFAELFVRGRLVVYNDATATANNIVASQLLFRAGFAGQLLMLVSDVIVTTLLYIIFREVNRTAALLSTFFRMVAITVLGITALLHFAAVVVLKGDEYLSVFSPHQLHAMALLSLKLHSYGYDISLMFFGFHLIFLGYLANQSRFLPKVIGLLLFLAAMSYLLNSFTRFLAPHLAAKLFPLVMVFPFIAELSFSLYLIKGLRVTR